MRTEIRKILDKAYEMNPQEIEDGIVKLFEQRQETASAVDTIVSVLREKAEKLEASAKIQAKIGNMDSTRNQLNMAHHLRMSASYLD